MSKNLETIRLPNSGCRYRGTRYDSETDTFVIEYSQIPGFHLQTIQDTGIPLPTKDRNKVRYERVESPGARFIAGSGISQNALDEIARSDDPLEAARAHVNRAVDDSLARAGKAYKKFLERSPTNTGSR